MNGVTLLETVVVIAIIAVLSLFSVNNINNFRNDAVLDNTANEVVSEIRFARSKSMNGEMAKNETEDSFEIDGLPEYGLNIYSNRYELIRKCTKADGSTCADEPPLETAYLDPQYSLSPEGTIFFQRISGNSPEENIILSSNGKPKRQITVSKGLSVTINKI